MRLMKFVDVPAVPLPTKVGVCMLTAEVLSVYKYMPLKEYRAPMHHQVHYLKGHSIVIVGHLMSSGVMTLVNHEYILHHTGNASLCKSLGHHQLREQGCCTIHANQVVCAAEAW